MPMYEYRCADCGHEFEVIQKFSDAPLTQCPKCSGIVAKLISQSGFQLKGSGWYVTDYARKDSGAKPTSGKPESKTESAGEPKSDSKTESKTEGKSESKAEAAAAPAPVAAKKAD